jgi:murein DD-endopeptidase MepM/ murein hydrolase activator NlpD
MLTNISQSRRFYHANKRTYKHLLWATWGIAYSFLAQAESIGASSPGGIYVWEIPTAATEIRFANRPIFTVNGKAIIGVPISQEPGEAAIDFLLENLSKKETFRIKKKNYTEQRITLADTKMVSPPAKELERIRKESAAQREVYASFTPKIDLSQGFIMPLEGRKTSLYGHRRFFNDVPRSPHSGLDIAAPTGTPIVAPGPGRVALRGDFYFNGKTILLDHGQGLITMYCHMSEYMVEEGEFIDQGQMLGLVGSTGRSTGPHLHWSVSLNNFRIDPLEFLPAVNEALK